MRAGYFSRVDDRTSFTNLIANVELQKKEKCKPLQYYEYAIISISLDEFEEISRKISKTHPCYEEYTTYSVAIDGIWNCIIIRCETDDREIILYTAGRNVPLYATVSDSA